MDTTKNAINRQKLVNYKLRLAAQLELIKAVNIRLLQTWTRHGVDVIYEEYRDIESTCRSLRKKIYTILLELYEGDDYNETMKATITLFSNVDNVIDWTIKRFGSLYKTLREISINSDRVYDETVDATPAPAPAPTPVNSRV